MAKQQKSPKPYKSPVKGANDEGRKFVARNLMKMKDGGACCVPTPAEPVSLHKKLAGAC